jgi:hypothetical protein
MKRWPNKFPVWLGCAVGATLVAEMAWLECERRHANQQTLQWRQQLRQPEELAVLAPALTSENEQAMATDVAQVQHGVAVLRAELFSSVGESAGDVSPVGRIDAYFDLAALVARLRDAADAANVSVKPDEHFGFGAYANEGPAVASLASVQRQGLAGEAILGCLFSAQPQALLAVKREPGEPSHPAGDRQPRDHVVVQRGLSLRRPGEIETVAFRVEFSGETTVLREFLSALAHASEMLVVRSIDVAPPVRGGSERAGGRGKTTGSVAQQAPSHFVVTVEAVSLSHATIADTP